MSPESTNRQRALELSIGLAANGRIDAAQVVPTAKEYAAFLDGNDQPPA